MVKWYFDSKGVYPISFDDSTPFGPYLFETKEDALKKFIEEKEKIIKGHTSIIGANFKQISLAFRSLAVAKMSLMKKALKIK